MEGCQTIEKLDFQIIYHNATFTVTLFAMLEMLFRNVFGMYNIVFSLNFSMANSNLSSFYAMFSATLSTIEKQ